MPHPSLKDIAASAGVSFQTVSKALNGKGRMSAETRRRVLDVAASLGYVPNGLARGLLNQATATVGVLSADFSDTTLAQIVVGIEREARRLGYSVIVGSLDEAGTDWARYLRVLLERRVDGIIFNAPSLEHETAVGEVLPASLPVVSLNRIAGVPHASRVFADTFGGAAMAVRHLTSLGHRQIGMVTGKPSRAVTQLRMRAYRQVLREVDIPFDRSLVEEGDWGVEGGYRAAHRLVDRRPDLTALYVQNDMMAVGVLAALHERRIDVPGDCSVVGCDDLPIAARTIPPLTTVQVPFQDLGVSAIRLLVERIQDPERPSTQVTLPLHMVYRDSSRTARTRAALSSQPEGGPVSRR